MTRRERLFQNAMRNAAVAMASYAYGWPIDRKRQEQIAAEIIEQIASHKSQLKELLQSVPAPPEFLSRFNPASSKQTGKLFYDYLEEPVRHRTDTGAPSTGKEALQTLASFGSPLAAELARTLRSLREEQKLYDAYIKNLSGIDIVRPAAAVTAQLSGRWSYKAPALQTTPKRIKPMFTAHPGCYLVAADLSQAELRNIAQLSGDPNMMQAYRNGEDIHAATAMAAFGCTPQQAKEKKFRGPAKIIGLGYNYSVLDDEKAALGLHAQLIARAPDLTYESVLGIIRRLRAARPGVRTYKEQIWKQAQIDDYVEEPLSGRRRKFWGRPKDTEVYNFPCQAMTAHIVDSAIQNCHREFKNREGAHLQRHDELVIGGPDPHRLCTMLWKHLRQTHTVRGNTITYEIEFQIGNRWGDHATVEPADSTTKDDPEQVNFNVAYGDEKDRLFGLRAAVNWVTERIPPQPISP